MKNVLLRNKLLTQCSIQIHFNQNLPDDTDLIVRTTMSGNFSFEPLVHEVERYGGMSFFRITEHSESYQQQANWGDSQTEQETNTTSQSNSTQTGTSAANGVANSSQESQGAVDTLSAPVAHGTRPEQESHADSRVLAKSATTTTTSTTSQISGVTTGSAKAIAKGASQQTGGSLGKTIGLSHKLVPLPNPPVREKQLTGQLTRSFNDQLEELKQWLACLCKRHAIVSVPWEREAFEIVTLDVPDPFESIEAQMMAVEWVKRELHGIHAYFFTPDVTVEEEERRLREFLGTEADVMKPELIETGETVEPECDRPQDSVYGF